MSAIAPAGREKTSKGSVEDADMSPTHRAEPVNSNISHEAATAWRKDPTFEKMAANHNARKRAILRGATACDTPSVYGRPVRPGAAPPTHSIASSYRPLSIFPAIAAAVRPEPRAELIPPPPTHAPANRRFGIGDFGLLRLSMFSTVCSRP